MLTKELAVDPLLEACLCDGGILGDSCWVKERCDNDGIDAADARLSTDFRGLAEDISFDRLKPTATHPPYKGDRRSGSRRYPDIARAECATTGLWGINADQQFPNAPVMLGLPSISLKGQDRTGEAIRNVDACTVQPGTSVQRPIG